MNIDKLKEIKSWLSSHTPMYGYVSASIVIEILEAILEDKEKKLALESIKREIDSKPMTNHVDNGTMSKILGVLLELKEVV